MTTRREQILARMTEITEEMDKLLGHEKMTRAQELRNAQLTEEFAELERQRIAIDLASGLLRTEAGVPPDPYVSEPQQQWGARPKFRGDPWAQPPAEVRAGVSAGALRAQALTAIERCEAMPDEARQKATLDLEADDDPAAGLARATIELSQPQYRSAFVRWLRDPIGGYYEWSPEERAAVRRVKNLTRAMSLGSGGSGGFLAPYELDAQILISGPGSVDPMRRVARVTTTAYNEKRFVTAAGVTASWDAEAAEVSDDSPTLLQPTITCFKGSAFVPVSLELFEDTDIAQQVGRLFADAKAQLESTAFTTGSGAGQPKGVITAVSAVGGSVLATGSNTLATADVYANQNALPPRWRPNAQFMANLSIINGYRALPKATNINESFVDDSGPTPRMAGWQIVENSAMDGTLNASAADYALLSGDFAQYAIVDRIGTTVEFIPHLFAPSPGQGRPTGQRGFYMHWRTGGDVLIADAFRLTNYSG